MPTDATVSSKPVAFSPSVSASAKYEADIVTPLTGHYAVDLQAAARKAHGVHLEKGLAETLFKAFVDRVVYDLSAGRHVSIQGFGSFNLHVKKRKGKPNVLRVRFEPSAKLRVDLENIKC